MAIRVGGIGAMPKIQRLLASCALIAGLMAAPAQAAEFKWAAPLDAYTLDPHAVDNTFVLSVLSNVYEPLIRRAADLSLEPALATEWHQDGDVWRFKLRQGVKFQNGSPFNADDVVFSFNRSQHSGVEGMLATVESITRVDDYTIEMKTRGVDPILPLEITEWLIMDKEWAEANGAVKAASADNKDESFATRNMNGTGPFKVTEREPNIRTVMVANPDWWDKPQHNIDKSTFFVIANPATRVSALLSGEVDMIQAVPPQDAERVGSTEGFHVMSGPDVRVIYLQMDVARDELLFSSVKGANPFKDQRVREALRLAVDSEVIHKKVMRGFSVPTGTLVAKEVNGYNDAVGAPTVPDVEKAKKLLAEAGYPNGFSVTLDCTNDRFVMDEAICITQAGLMARIGVDVQPRAQTVGRWAQQINPPEYKTSFAMVGFTPATYDAHNMLQTIVGTRDPNSGRGIFNIGGYSDKKVDDLIARIQVETDADKRRGLIGEALAIIKESAAYIPLHQQMVIWGIKNGIDLKQRADGGLPLRLIHLQ